MDQDFDFAEMNARPVCLDLDKHLFNKDETIIGGGFEFLNLLT